VREQIAEPGIRFCCSHRRGLSLDAGGHALIQRDNLVLHRRLSHETLQLLFERRGRYADRLRECACQKLAAVNERLELNELFPQFRTVDERIVKQQP